MKKPNPTETYFDTEHFFNISNDLLIMADSTVTLKKLILPFQKFWGTPKKSCMQNQYIV
jgi:hypothetical protein